MQDVTTDIQSIGPKHPEKESVLLVSQYNEFVKSSDQYANISDEERKDIALYGLVSEIGSVLSEIKKKLLVEDGIQKWSQANSNIIEELGDVTWYCFSYSQITNKHTPVNIFLHNIALLKKEISAEDKRAEKIHAALDQEKREDFLIAAANFPNTNEMTFADYQNLAFLTARTKGKQLLEVCVAVLWQLGAELLREKLPSIEMELNKEIADRDTNIVLGEIAWHLAAIASLFKLSMDSIAEYNQKKVSFRLDRDFSTPLHDENFQRPEQFPRKFEVAFVTVGPGRSRMYFEGKALGDELTDNSYNDDGYRFHDVMHLANAAHLGWSPVLRSLLGCKRKSDKQIDEVEDGARAKIIEEAIIKAIHSEGVRLHNELDTEPDEKPRRLFPSRQDITFKFLKFIHTFTDQLEVEKNKFWEWEDAIFDGYGIFFELCKEGQGTITVSLEDRTLKFQPELYIELTGNVSGVGSSTVEIGEQGDGSPGRALHRDLLTDAELSRCAAGSGADAAGIVAAKSSIFDAIGFRDPGAEKFSTLDIRLLDSKHVSVKASGETQKRIWSQKIINFKITLNQHKNIVSCTAIAITDPSIY